MLRGLLTRGSVSLSLHLARSPLSTLGVGFSALSPRSLKEVCKLELFESQDSDKCKEIWTSYHETKKDATGMHVSKETCASVLMRAKTCPVFIFPIFKSEESYLVLLSQFMPNTNSFVFAYLEEYKKNPTAAAPWISVALYDDLTASKGIGLLRADFMPSISKKEATVLCNMLIEAYSGTLAPFSEAFNRTPDRFNFEDYSKASKAMFCQRFLG